jgi:prefoldin subunit 4
MASKNDKSPVDVTREDQARICTFGRMHTRHQQLSGMLAAKKKNLADISDASDEVYISDATSFVLGEAFVQVDAAEAEEMLTARKAREAADMARYEAEFTKLEAAMKDLKAKLYAKFGSQIYLESE